MLLEQPVHNLFVLLREQWTPLSRILLMLLLNLLRLMILLILLEFFIVYFGGRGWLYV